MRVSDTVISDEEFAARFEAAKERCLAGDEAGCTYGGLTPSGGFWLALGECPLDHGCMLGVGVPAVLAAARRTL